MNERLVFAAGVERAEPNRTERVEALYRAHHALVYRLALRYGSGNRAWAEDLTQEVFIRLFDAIDGLHTREGFEGWLYRVTTNRCLNRLRAEAVRNATPTRWLLRRALRRPDDPEQLVSAQQGLSRAQAAVAALPPKERVAFSMHYVDGKSQQEIAAVLGHSKGYVSKLVARAEARVRAAGWELSE